MKKILLLFPALFISLFSNAQFTPDSTVNTLISDDAGVEEITPRLTPTTNGYTYVSWFKFNSGTSQYDLYMQLLDSLGVAKWNPGGLLISSQPQASFLARYDLKTDNKGNAVVAFQDQRTGSNFTIAVYKINQQGSHVFNQNGITVKDSLATDNMAPVIGITRFNETVVAWNCTDATNNKWISVMKYNNGGNPLYTTPIRVRDASGGKKFSRPTIVASPDTNGFVMCYVQETGNFPAVTSILLAQRYNHAGNGVWSSQKQLSTLSIPYFFFPSPLTDSQGGFYLAFNAPNSANPMHTDVYVQHIDSSGNTWNTTGNPVSSIPNLQRFYYEGCITKRNNTILVAYQNMDAGQTMGGIGIQTYDLNGVLQFGNGVDILPQSSNIISPFGFDNAGNGAILTYSVTTGQNMELRAMLVNYNGSAGWTRSLCSVASGKDDMTAGDVINGQLVTAWMDERMDHGIYAQNISAYGSAGDVTGIGKTEAISGALIYPNPSKNPEIRIEGSLQGISTIEITDITGKLVLRDEFYGRIYHPKTDLRPGIYPVRIMNNGTSVTLHWLVE